VCVCVCVCVCVYDRSKLAGMQRGLIHGLRAMQLAAKRAILLATSNPKP
jgi:hypothetical protein